MNKLTEEQLAIIDAIKDYDKVAINAIAGSGKTTMLTEISRALKIKKGLYLAYNKSIADEAKTKFPSEIECRTIHSLAYRFVVGKRKLQIGTFSFRDIRERMPFERKILFIEVFNSYLNSSYVKVSEFMSDLYDKIGGVIDDKFEGMIKKILKEMSEGKRQITHSAYLKIFHIEIANKMYSIGNYDLIMIDEAGDLNPVTFDIFMKLDAKKKVMVGDKDQNIYGFNDTINAFDEIDDSWHILPMTQSFRCSKELAKKIEKFAKKYIDRHFKFTGSELCDDTIHTSGMISRTNSTLIGKMIDMTKAKIKFKLTRSPQQVFELINILMNLKPGGEILSKEWKFLQKDVDEWEVDLALQHKHKSPRSYIASKYNNDPAISSAMNILAKYDYGEIFAAFNAAKQNAAFGGKVRYYLGTAHSTKGLEWDEVTILDDLNQSALKAIDVIEGREKGDKKKANEELRLYYVACSRAKKKLHNASVLELL